VWFAGTPEANSEQLSVDYFRIRDFEYAQPLCDLAYLLEVDAIAKSLEISKYRTFALWRAAYSFDGYCTLIDKWLDNEIKDAELDYVPSGRIRNYLEAIRESGTLPELNNYKLPQYQRVLRLRAIRGLGLSQAAKLLGEHESISGRWLNEAAAAVQMPPSELLQMMESSYGTWQSAHIVPPLVRLLRAFEVAGYDVSAIDMSLDGIRPMTEAFVVEISGNLSRSGIESVLAKEPLFHLKAEGNDEFAVEHQLGWYFRIRRGVLNADFDLSKWAKANDPLLETRLRLKGDLHLHTSWSDGNASLADMAEAARKSGLEYCGVTDHSRSCKLQGGLTPAAWLRQASSISLNRLTLPILHGIEVDILEEGTLDLPEGLLSGMNIVVASVHSSWTADEQVNTRRLINAIESGQIDVIGHPTSAVVGKPGVPNYVRHPARVDWEKIFAVCAKWMVALELNCFPSRLDLPVEMLARAIKAGCWISLGSDAHSRSHLAHLRFGQRLTENLKYDRILRVYVTDSQVSRPKARERVLWAHLSF
jgi:histidinol phosphatase-like PHP family hydrolase